jgi:hypothetical protein
MIPHKCPVCDGTGKMYGSIMCHPCKGSGIVWENVESPPPLSNNLGDVSIDGWISGSREVINNLVKSGK